MVIVEALRTPHGRFGGSLKGHSAVDLGVAVVKALLDRTGVEPEAVDEVFLGNAWQAGVGPNAARLVTVEAGLPVSVPATSINGWGMRMGDRKTVDLVHHDGFVCPLAGMLMGATADLLAEEYSIPREEQDEFAWGSQQKTAKALESGAMERELVPIQLKDGTFDVDETPRPKTTLEELSALPPVFGAQGTVTAGNNCAMADGASVALLASGRAAERIGLEPLGRILGYSRVGVEPKRMGIGPAAAVPLALERAKLALEDMEIIEVNEAFAAPVLACKRELNWASDLVNPYGGSIALGHPVAATGTGS